MSNVNIILLIDNCPRSCKSCHLVHGEK